MLLEIRNVEASYGPFSVLHGVSMDVESGKIVAVMGPNGAGKTTLLRTISGMIPTLAGSTTFDGIETKNLKPHEIARLGIIHVPEGRQIFSDLAVIENLKVASYDPFTRKKREENLEMVFDLFPVLKERAVQKAGTLSGGERQMLCTAIGFMNCPKILLLDEPSTGLAPRTVMDLFKKIEDICKNCDVSILLVEQQARLAMRIASMGYVLIDGKIVLGGPVTELSKNEDIKKQYLTI